ncbi:MAG: helix-turn-helix transcriptional regulator [Clostridia bacterium]|nr:helix-turn-helix transcriptional regulator [Clostridia bacterium]
MNKFSERIKELRVEKGYSRKHLAGLLFISERLVSYWENGQRECDFDMLIKISNVFNVSIDFLLGKSNF